MSGGRWVRKSGGKVVHKYILKADTFIGHKKWNETSVRSRSKCKVNRVRCPTTRFRGDCSCIAYHEPRSSMTDKAMKGTCLSIGSRVYPDNGRTSKYNLQLFDWVMGVAFSCSFATTHTNRQTTGFHLSGILIAIIFVIDFIRRIPQDWPRLEAHTCLPQLADD
jgi:hypothetical protein